MGFRSLGLRGSGFRGSGFRGLGFIMECRVSTTNYSYDLGK